MTVLVAHADWSVSPLKRWMAVATPSPSGWTVGLERVGDLGTLLARLLARGAGAAVALGVDAPIGLPAAYGSSDEGFPQFLRRLDPAGPFFDVCDDPAHVCRNRPFYPKRGVAGVRRQALLDGLGIGDPAALLRRCEQKLGSQPAASPMFWTLGANQVGKGALRLWAELLIPALRGPAPPSLWPFDGSMAALLKPGRVVIAESYPANAMRQMALGFKGSKRRQSDRVAVAPTLRGLLERRGAQADGDLAAQISDGFGAGNDGEDRFDGLIGLIRMLQVIQDPALDRLPDAETCRWEGWILGRPVSIA